MQHQQHHRVPSAATAAPTMGDPFQPTQAELELVDRILRHADPQQLGILTGEAAMNVFRGTHLPHEQLGHIWALADTGSRGFLTRWDIAIALRLIGRAQHGESPSPAHLAIRVSNFRAHERPHLQTYYSWSNCFH